MCAKNVCVSYTVYAVVEEITVVDKMAIHQFHIVITYTPRHSSGGCGTMETIHLLCFDMHCVFMYKHMFVL